MKPLIAGCLAGPIIVAGVFLLGGSSIEDTLAGQARSIGQAWYHAAMHGSRGDLGALTESIHDPYERQTLRASGIDAVLLVASADKITPLLQNGTDAVASFRQTIRANSDRGAAELMALPAGSYTSDDIGWLEAAPYETWVLLPAASSAGPRLAVQIDQTAAATQLLEQFFRHLIYKFGIGVVAFFAFMAGYTYRAKHLMKDNEELQRVALHDELTGLPNRKQFDTRLQQAIDELKGGEHTAVMLLDLDGFKAVNDTLGHHAGDDLLKATAKRLSSALRERDILARLSGDEFAIVVPRFSEVSPLTAIAKRIQVLLSEAFDLAGQRVTIGCSMGIAVAPENGDTPETLFRNADFALYRAKSEGKRTWRFFDPQMAQELQRRLTIEDGLRASVDRDMFTIVYQPQIDLRAYRIVGYEAFVRWRLPGDRMVTTASFLQVAEETGLIIPIGEKVIRQVARDCVLLPQDTRIALNLSAAQLKREGIADLFRVALQECGIAPSRIEVEVNESILGRDEATTLGNLSKIRQLGVRVVLDDFGPSSFGLLTRWPFDKMKLSGDFLSGVISDAKSRSIVAAICNLGHSLDMEVAAQGVESEDLAKILPLLGCTQAQGHFFGFPRLLSHIVRQAPDRIPQTDEQIEAIDALDPLAILLTTTGVADTDPAAQVA